MARAFGEVLGGLPVIGRLLVGVAFVIGLVFLLDHEERVAERKGLFFEGIKAALVKFVEIATTSIRRLTCRSMACWIFERYFGRGFWPSEILLIFLGSSELLAYNL